MPLATGRCESVGVIPEPLTISGRSVPAFAPLFAACFWSSKSTRFWNGRVTTVDLVDSFQFRASPSIPESRQTVRRSRTSYGNSKLWPTGCSTVFGQHSRIIEIAVPNARAMIAVPRLIR